MKAKSRRLIGSFIVSFAILFSCVSVINTASYAERINGVVVSAKVLVNPNPVEREVELMAETIIFFNPLNYYFAIARASFKSDGKIYAVGHAVAPQYLYVADVYRAMPQVGVKNDDYSALFMTSVLIGQIEENNNNGVIITDNGNYAKKYSSFPVANEIYDGEAYFLIRNEQGKIRKIPINIEFIQYEGETHLSYYLEDEWLLSNGGFQEGTSGSPIMQNGKIIGVHWATDNDDKLLGIAKVIWNTDFFK